ncbi:hypothetical protein ABBQ32_000961 [Trebouxia sp. C0010 RCD-2024]
MQTSVTSGHSCHRLSCAKTLTARSVVRGSEQKRRRGLACSKDNGASREKISHTNGSKPDEPWENLAFPTYLQSEVDDFCQDWDEALQLEERRQSDASRKDATRQSRSAVTQDNPVWQAIRKEAAKDAAQEPILSSFLYASVLSHDSFEQSLAAILANRLSDPTMMATELIDIFHSVLRSRQEVQQAALADVIAVRERDPACTAYSSALLYYKGYHALQTHRIAHGLWERGQTVLARSLQYRCTQTLAVDIHPAAKIGKGVLLDHGTGLVIGETAVVGNNVSILHNVTLGGTGKEVGDRHPKVNDNVLIGASATILGNISIGKGAQVAAGSLVLKNVPPRTMVAGSPAKEVGKVTGNPALKMQHWMKNQLVKESYAEQWEDIVRSGAASSVRRRSETSIISPAGDASKGKAPANGSAPTSKLPAEFGAKDKVPARGTAPMGPQDYADGSQWTERDGTIQRRETAEDGANSEDGARDRGYIGGDGAKLGGAVRHQATDGAKDLASSIHTSEDQDRQDSSSKASPEQSQGSQQLPDQARAQPSGGHGAGLGSNREAGQAVAASASSSNGAKPDGGKDVSASNDSDWWRELTAASKKNDCTSAGSAASSNQNQQNGARPQQGANQGTKAGQKDRASSGWDTSSSSPRQGLGGQTGSTSRASGSKSASLSLEEKADIERRTQDVKELASKIENQVPGMKEPGVSKSNRKQPQQPPPDIEYWI